MNFFTNALLAILVFVLVACAVLLIWVLAIEIGKCFLRYEENPVTVTVVNKVYNPEYSNTTFMNVGKGLVPQVHYHPAEYKVYAKWRNEIYPIDNKELFDNVKKDDVVTVKAHVGYNKDGVEKDVYLTYK